MITNEAFKLEFSPRFHEVDSYRIVHHSAYLWWFEEARIQFLNAAGINLKHFEKDEIQIVLLSAHLRFVTPVRLFEDVWVETRLNEEAISKLNFTQKVIFRSNRQLAVEAQINCAALQSGKMLLKLPPLLQQALKPTLTHP